MLLWPPTTALNDVTLTIPGTETDASIMIFDPPKELLPKTTSAHFSVP